MFSDEVLIHTSKMKYFICDKWKTISLFVLLCSIYMLFIFSKVVLDLSCFGMRFMGVLAVSVQWSVTTGICCGFSGQTCRFR